MGRDFVFVFIWRICSLYNHYWIRRSLFPGDKLVQQAFFSHQLFERPHLLNFSGFHHSNSVILANHSKMSFIRKTGWNLHNYPLTHSCWFVNAQEIKWALLDINADFKENKNWSIQHSQATFGVNKDANEYKPLYLIRNCPSLNIRRNTRLNSLGTIAIFRETAGWEIQ